MSAATRATPAGAPAREVLPRGVLPSARSAYLALGAGSVLLLAVSLDVDGPYSSVIYLLCAALGTAMSIAGAVRMPPARRRIWWAFAVAQMLMLVGDSLWTLFDDVLHVDLYPSVADIAYLANYPALALGMMWLIRGRRRGRDRAAFLDAAILATGFAVVGTVFFVAPAATTGGSTLIAQVVAAAYPVGDLLVLALLFRVVTTGLVRNESLWALFAAMTLTLVADLYYVVTVSQGAPYFAWLDLGYLASYLLLGFAAMHPSAHALSEPAPDRPDRITAARLTWLGVALMLAPATDQLARLIGVRHITWVALVGSLLASVLVVMRLWDLVTDLQRKAVQLAALARKDGLTGVPNRRTWDHELSRACAFAVESRAPLSAAVLDLDHFKLFNDSHGHLTGDQVLKETAAAWASILAGRGFLARYGGEEFTVLLPNTSSADAEAVLERLRRSVTRSQTCSIGFATWDGTETPEEFVGRADRALYLAKRAGRDRIAMHDGHTTRIVNPAGPDSSTQPILHTVYQPIVDLQTGETVGHEALSRFDGQHSRAVFDRAHRDGTGPSLERAALQSAIGSWYGDGYLSLNVSLTALLTAEVQQALPEVLDRIVLEITETDLVDYTADVMVVLDHLRARGAQIAIDDVGVGFSNARRIADIRPDILKVDISLIRGIDREPMLQGILTAALGFATATGSRLVAEGIETSAERDCLAALGIPLGQGFFLGLPAPMSPRIRSGKPSR